MKTPFTLFTILLLSLGLSSCEEESPVGGNETTPLQAAAALQVEHRLVAPTGNVISPGDTVRLTNGIDFAVSKYRFYLSNLKLTHQDGRTFTFRDVYLGDIADSSVQRFLDSVPLGTFRQMSLGLGLDPVTNNALPESFQADHPLSTFNQMYWTMLKYRFAILEGRANNRGNLGSSTDALIAYHPGTDPLYREYSQAINWKLDDTNQRLLIQIETDLDALIQGSQSANAIDLLNEPQSHSDAATLSIAEKYMDNWLTALSLRGEEEKTP